MTIRFRQLEGISATSHTASRLCHPFDILLRCNPRVFVDLNKLEKVCLNDNPISLMFPNNIKPLCDSNPNCSIKINEKCIKETTIIGNNLIKYI